MATSYEHEEIVKRLRVMIHGLISSGVIPCSERDIIEGRLPFEKDQLFLNFGINLRMAITCFPLDPIIPLVKIDSHYDVNNKTDDFILQSLEDQYYILKDYRQLSYQKYGVHLMEVDTTLTIYHHLL